MDTTFITIHDLTENAHILYCSDSIVDILGHTPDEVVDRSCWQFFHPEEIPLAKQLHSRGVRLDKAAVLSYCRIKNRQGDWVGCECCFSIVYDVMVCCTSIYRYGMNSQKRAADAPLVRKKFSSSPKDPRYHMLTHLSSKFTLGTEYQMHEPRAALFINRFTRSLTVMYATSGIEQVIGISSDEMTGRSFYYCIEENCLQDAVTCLESAKGNDSIAYMRFFFRDPRQADPPERAASESDDDIMTDVISDDESESDLNADRPPTLRAGSSNDGSRESNGTHTSNGEGPLTSHTNSSMSTRPSNWNSAAPFASPALSGSSSLLDEPPEPIELEAVISCTSDGLVVCLRRARPMLPEALVPAALAPQHTGIFAAPWAKEPVFFPNFPQQPPYPVGTQHPATAQAGPPAPFQSTFLQSIRDVAVFAWALVGINGSLTEHSRGIPIGESQPPNGFSVYDPLPVGKMSATPSGYVSGSTSNSDPYGFGDPGLN